MSAFFVRLRLFFSRWRRLKLWLRLSVYCALVVASLAAFWGNAAREDGFNAVAGVCGAALVGASVACFFVFLLFPALTGKDPDVVHRVHEKTEVQKVEGGSLWYIIAGCEIGIVASGLIVLVIARESFHSFQPSVWQILLWFYLILLLVPIGATLGQSLWLMTISRSQPPQIIEEILHRDLKSYVPFLTPLRQFVGKYALAKSVKYHAKSN